MEPIKPIPLDEIRSAQQRIRNIAIRTPLIRMEMNDAPCEIFLKLENLQPIGSFKLRGSGNAIQMASREMLSDGIFTASAGNMAQGVAWNAKRLGDSVFSCSTGSCSRNKVECNPPIGRLNYQSSI